MTLASKPKQKKTLGNCAHSALQKHLKKTVKWEAAVKKDKDPEALHQMRVGMRRLRTTVTSFAPALDLPKAAGDKNIGKIARCLGNLRDLDVLKDTLENLYQPRLPRKEQEQLDTALDVLGKQREDALSNVKVTLKDERYKSLKEKLQEWLEEPTYQPLGAMAIEQVLPDLLLPEISEFLLHPGWLIGTELQETEIVISRNLKAAKVEQQLAENGETLHSLRKQAKRLRYQMELFTDIYDEPYMTYVEEIKHIQEILGGMQDSVVLAEWLAHALKSDVQTQVPTLAALLAENRYQLWQQWQPLQEQYLKAETRQRLHSMVLQLI
ncbi:CHAD domain-containing protein [Scytonema sp. UIC 10036]|uniref:CHAD domain-containing protein n=1 Tax=Scytonema sp. UIC 10036 TaxID=2304196 RepID=UPI0012DA0D53|nr:CHAD domain-containing protein [Scytonema sp. UIC 10036]MUG94227.1 CHAD domain-containing protein [Scytonema sp. UIC 10036]